MDLIITYKMNYQSKKSVYEAPRTELFKVQFEGALMAGSQPAAIKEESPIEVEEYESFENEVTFE